MNSYLVWLYWPEKCFRADAGALRCLAALVPPGSRVKSVRSERAFLGALPEATHAIVWHFKREWFACAPHLKVLATPGAGRELVPTEGPEGVKIHFGGYHGAIISETVAGFILAWSRGFFRPELHTGSPWRSSWPRTALGGVCSRIAGTRAVIAGYGRIGRAIGSKLEALGVTVEGFGRRNIAGLPDAVRGADWFIMALPSGEETNGFLNERLLCLLPKRAVVVNVGRGNAVDEAALLAALRQKRIAGAYLDVFRGEPGPLAGIAGLDIPEKGGNPAARDILGSNPADLPDTLVMTPHSSAFCADYLALCFKELKDDGLI